jgi:biopolymer transport protein ExbB/TolQ
MTVSDILLTAFVILLFLGAFITFGLIAWSIFEETKVGEAITEWLISKFKGDDEK